MTWIDRAAPVTFLNLAFEPDDWIGVLLKSYETGRVVQRVVPVATAKTDQFLAWLRHMNARGFNVYVTVNVLQPGRSRRRTAIGAVRHVFLDEDRDIDRLLAALTARKGLPPLSYHIRTSARRGHVLWRVRGFSLDTAEELQRALAEELNTDSAATPSTQSTRLPGFRNRKDPDGFLVRVVGPTRTATYGPEDFRSARTRRRAHVENSMMCPTRTRRQLDGDSSRRARRYLAAVPPAVSGRGGDAHTFRVCCRLVRGFDLSDDDAVAALCEWNARCEPPWLERELRQKVANARRYGREAIGGLLETSS